MFAAAVVQGTTVLLGVARPTSIETAVPAPMRLAWGAILALGGAAVLVGLYWPANPVTGIEIKRPGLVACGGAALAYGVALIPLGAPGIVVAVWQMAFAVACFWRWWQVSRRIRTVRRRLVEARRRR